METNKRTTLREADKIAKDTAISAKHTPMRLEVSKIGVGFEIEDEFGNVIAQAQQVPNDTKTHDARKANARRLAACWNVCQGATTEQLERSKDLTGFVLAAQEIERQKTALLNAVMRLAGRGFFDVSPMTQSEALENLEMMRKAIEKATTK